MAKGIFQIVTPAPDRCSICGSRVGPFVFEERSTGKDFARQRWPYCADCWSLIHQEPGPDPDPARGDCLGCRPPAE